MSETRQILNEKKAITPLWIVALFVSLTETVLGIAVIQTGGGIQIALTTFVLAFPVLIAGSFFMILWHKPYVFYPPTEFGQQINVGEYVEAMQRRPALLMQYSERRNVPPPTDKEIYAAKEIIDSFIVRIPTNGLLYLYAFSLAHSKKGLLDLNDFCTTTSFFTDDYPWGVLVATYATNLIDFRIVGEAVNIIAMNQKLKDHIQPEIERRIKDENRKRYDKNVSGKEDSLSWIQEIAAKIEDYFK